MSQNNFEDIKASSINESVYSSSSTILINGDSLINLQKIPDVSIGLILTDPPYHTTKKKIYRGIQILRIITAI